MKDRKFVPSPVNVGLRKTEVEMWLPSLVRRMSRKGRELLFSNSTVNLMLLCLEFKYAKNFGICSGLLKRRNVSSMYLL